MSQADLQNKGLVKERVFWLDVARVFAIISITLNHAVNRTFDMHENTMLEFSTISLGLSVFKGFVQVLSRIGVPIFLMITGALLLKRDYTKEGSLNKFYKRNWTSLLLTAEVWYLIIFAYKSLAPDSLFRTKGIVAALIQLVCNQLFINQDTFTSMWYMPMILCVYLVIPFIAVGVQKFERKLLLIPLSIAFLSAFMVPNVNSAVSLVSGNTDGSLISFALSVTNLFSMYVIYVVLGYWISDGVLERIKSPLLIIVTVFAFVLTSVYQVWAFTRPGNYIVEYNSTGVLITAILLFECFRRFGNGLLKIKKPVTVISEISFGIYFVHICVMEGIKKFVSIGIGRLPYFFILEIGSFVASVIIILVLKRFKRISKILFRL